MSPDLIVIVHTLFWSRQPNANRRFVRRPQASPGDAGRVTAGRRLKQRLFPGTWRTGEREGLHQPGPSGRTPCFQVTQHLCHRCFSSRSWSITLNYAHGVQLPAGQRRGPDPLQGGRQRWEVAQGHGRQVGLIPRTLTLPLETPPSPPPPGLNNRYYQHLCRTGKDGYIQVDGGAAVHGQSRGRSIMVNTKGNVYLGESPVSRPAFKL